MLSRFMRSKESTDPNKFLSVNLLDGATEQDESKDQECFKQQTKYFTIISTIAGVLQMILGLVGVLALENS